MILRRGLVRRAQPLSIGSYTGGCLGSTFGEEISSYGPGVRDELAHLRIGEDEAGERAEVVGRCEEE